jgi:hypothetical protein
MDFEKTMKFFEDNNINLISLNENFDTSTAIGRAVIRIILTFAQLEREQTSERTVDVMQFRAEQGIWTGGMPPLGYSNTKANGLLPIEEESKMIPVIFEKYLELASYKKVANWLNEAGLRPKCYKKEKADSAVFIDTAIARILKNPVYTGKILHKGKVYQGRHTPLISEDIFNKVQMIIKQHDRGRSSGVQTVGTHNFILEKILKCGHCGSHMTPRWSRAKGIRYFYYECTTGNHKGANACPTKPIRAASIESLILRRICAIKKDNIMVDSLIQNNVGALEKEIFSLESEKTMLGVRLSQATSKAQAIVDKLLTIPELSGSKILYDEINRLEQEKNNILSKIQEIGDKISQYKSRSFNAGEIQNMFKYFTDIYGKLNKEDKRLLMKVLIKEIQYKKEQMSISYYTNTDIIKPSIINTEDIGDTPRLPAPVWPRPTSGVINDPERQTAVEIFDTNTYIGRNGKVLISYI